MKILTIVQPDNHTCKGTKTEWKTRMPWAVSIPFDEIEMMGFSPNPQSEIGSGEVLLVITTKHGSTRRAEYVNLTEARANVFIETDEERALVELICEDVTDERK